MGLINKFILYLKRFGAWGGSQFDENRGIQANRLDPFFINYFCHEKTPAGGTQTRNK
jgi:hypothetical protein